MPEHNNASILHSFFEFFGIACGFDRCKMLVTVLSLGLSEWLPTDRL